MHRLRFSIIVSCFCLFVGNVVADDLVLKQYAEKVQPVVKQLCNKCHQGEKAKGDFRIDTLNPDMIGGEDQEAWHDALNRFNQGEMPPPKSKQPTAKQRDLLTQWISSSLEAASHAKRYTDGRVVTRRLTREQYQNTMEELLGVQLNYSRHLPPDPASPDGFLNNGLTLEMSPVQLETMLEAARAGLLEAIVSGPKPKIYQTSATQTVVGKMPQLKVAGVTQVAPEFILDTSLVRLFARHCACAAQTGRRSQCHRHGGSTARVRLYRTHGRFPASWRSAFWQCGIQGHDGIN